MPKGVACIKPMSEMIWRTVFQSRWPATIATGRWIGGYHNTIRRHSTLGWISPIAFKQEAAE